MVWVQGRLMFLECAFLYCDVMASRTDYFRGIVEKRQLLLTSGRRPTGLNALFAPFKV